jgi:hypothetical protein
MPTTTALFLASTLAPADLATTDLVLDPLFTTPTVAQVVEDAEPRLSWSFAEVHVLMRDVDVLDDDLRGFGARGAWELQEGFFVRGGLDFYSDDEDLTRFDLGFGQSVALQEGVKAFASVSWIHAEIDAGAGDADEDGWRVEGGARIAPEDKIELEVRLGWEDVIDDGLIWGADLRYWFVSNVALGLGFEREVDDDIWTLGLRYAF